MSFSYWSVRYVTDAGAECRLPCLDEADAKATAARLFDTYYSVRVCCDT